MTRGGGSSALLVARVHHRWVSGPFLTYVNSAQLENRSLTLRALAIDEKVLGPDHASTATSLNNLAGLYDTQGKYDLAEPLLKRAIAILDSAFGPSHPDAILYRTNLARMKADRRAAGK